VQPVEHSAVALDWRIFGSNGRRRPVADELAIEVFTRRAPDDWGPNLHIKSIVRPHAVKAFVNPHCVDISQGRYVHPSGASVISNTPGIVVKPDHRLPCVHHYFTRSRREWERKVARGYRDRTRRSLDEFTYYDRNEVFDSAAACLAPAVRKFRAMVMRSVPILPPAQPPVPSGLKHAM
jgi:hypothetical protein